MIFWLDAQIDPALAAWIGSRFGTITKHVVELDLQTSSDEALFAAAQRFAGVVIVTKDQDFVRLVQHHGAPPQVVHLRCGNVSAPQLHVLLSLTLPSAIERLQNGEPVVTIEFRP